MISLAPGSEGRYLGANAAFCEMLGYTPEELLLTMPDLTHVDDVERDSARFREVVDGRHGDSRSTSGSGARTARPSLPG